MAPPGKAPRTLTQMLRQWDDSALCRLLMARPDLATPHPTSFSQVASRATTRGSVADALQSLHAFDLWVAGRAHTQQAWMSTDTLAQEAPEEAVAEALGRLTASALMWGDGGSVRGVRAIGALLTDAPGSPPPAQPPRFDDVRRRSPPLVDKVAAGSAFELVRRVDVLVEHCDHEPARLRRSGGLSTRDARALAGLLDVPTAIALVHLEIAQSAGLLGTVAHGHDEVLIPTAQFDSWQSLELAEQWDDTAHAWTHHHAGSGSAAMKQLCLEAFGDPREGRVLSADDLHTWLAWQRPRRPAGTDKRATTMLEQASWLGITGLGALSSFGTSTDPGTLTTLLPERVGHVLVQADLTAVAPGPLTPDAARELGTLADVESRGGATVYRFSVESLRRAHDLGWTPEDILTTLQERSQTPLPQPLTYLIGDLDRPRVRPRPSPGPATTTHPHRAAERAPSKPVPPSEDYLEPATARQIVADLRRAADETTPAADLRMPESAEPMFDSPLATLREAVETGEVVWFGYVDTAGASGERMVHALSVEGGRLSARDARSGEALAVPVRRITSAHIIRAGG